MIIASVAVVPKTCTGKKGSIFRAMAIVGEQTFVGESRNGATCVLARTLVDAGIADQPMAVSEGKFGFTIGSIHKHAQRTYAETEEVPLRISRWMPFPGNTSLGKEGYEANPVPDSQKRLEAPRTPLPALVSKA